MTQTEDTAVFSRGQTKSNDEHSDRRHSKVDALEVYNQHIAIIRSLFEPGELDTKKNRDVLQKTDLEGRNVIHHLISELKRKKTSAPSNVLKFVQQLVLDEPELFTQADDDGKVPLLAAAEFNVEILFQVVNLVVPESVLESIKKNCDESHQSCPLRDVHESRRGQCPKKANPRRPVRPNGTRQREQNDRFETSIATGNEDVEDHCLCDRIDSNLVVEKDAQLRRMLSTALGLKKEQHPPCLHSVIAESNFDSGQEKDIQIIPLDSFKLLLQLCPDTVLESAAKEGFSPLLMAIRLYDKHSIDYDHLFLVIQALVDRSPSSIYFEAKGDSTKTAYHLLKELKKTNSESNTRSRSRTVDLLKRTCVGSPQKDWDAKMKFLYRDAESVRQVCLNLSGESSLLDEKYISTIRDRSGVQFETVLDFIRLPYWKDQNQKPQHQSISGGHREGEGVSDGTELSDPYTAIFRWLWDGGVRKIFTVEVDDDGRDSHTNAAIRQSLRNWNEDEKSYRDFEVEVWKWKKFDICTESIFNAAPIANEVYLYSSGNTAVLRGWACCSGLSKLTNLQRLTIEIHPKNANDEQDCRQYQPELERKLVEGCSQLKFEDIAVEYHPCQADQDDIDKQDQEKNPKNDKEPSNATLVSDEWIVKLMPFKQFIHDVLGSKEKSFVRVALLDDGAKLADLNGKQKGASFRPDNEEYFAGPCSHGTQMARCIRKICPMAELYIARLDDSQNVENQKFTTASAYKALQWALDMKADIISMSWTFKMKGSENDQDEKDFVDLIKTAVSSKTVILFGSLPDKGTDAETSQYAPVGLSGVIKIGSATIHGQKSPENRFADPDFLLPGEELTTPEGEKVRGSSFSTAYASGLAALILCCLRAHLELKNPYITNGALDPDDDDKTKRLKKAMTVEGMKTIFKVLSHDEIKGRVFVRPYITFGDSFEDSEEGKRKAMQRIVKEILPDKVLLEVQ